MSNTGFVLVLISIFTHAYWNYLLKGAGNKIIFVALSKGVELIAVALPVVYLIFSSPFESNFVLLATIGASFTFLNYFLLSRAYSFGALSLVYPVSRSSILFLPILAFAFIGERIDWVGALSLGLILSGTLMLHVESLSREGMKSAARQMVQPATLYALAAAFSVACYTLWDKVAIQRMQPLFYFYLYTVLLGLIYPGFIIARYPRASIQKEWRDNRLKIISVGLLNLFTYSLVLIALSTNKATYVSGLRQLSIVIGFLFGVYGLKETISLPRWMGLILSLLGGCLLYLAR